MTKQVDRQPHTVVTPEGTELAYHVVGSGPPLVCVPGGPGRASVYLEDLGGLAESRQLVEVDNPGTGASGRPSDPGGYAFPSLAANLESVRAALGVERLLLLGHSAGAVVAELYALTHPDRVEALVLVTPAGWPHDVSRNDVEEIKAARAGEPWFAHSREVLDQPEDAVPAREKTLAFRPFMYGAWTERQQAHATGADIEQDEVAEAHYWPADPPDTDTVRARAAAFDKPVLVLAGAHDAVTGVASAAAVAAGLPRAELVVLPESGHFPWVDEPETFRRAVGDFLARVSP